MLRRWIRTAQDCSLLKTAQRQLNVAHGSRPFPGGELRIKMAQSTLLKAAPRRGVRRMVPTRRSNEENQTFCVGCGGRVGRRGCKLERLRRRWSCVICGWGRFGVPMWCHHPSIQPPPHPTILRCPHPLHTYARSGVQLSASRWPREEFEMGGRPTRQFVKLLMDLLNY